MPTLTSKEIDRTAVYAFRHYVSLSYHAKSPETRAARGVGFALTKRARILNLMDPTTLPDVEKMLGSEHLQLYKLQIRDMWGRLIHIHSNLEVMRRIESYGLDEILDSHALGFWQLLLGNFGDTVIMTLATLVVDQKQDTLNLLGFSRDVGRWLKPKYQDEYREQLRNTRFEKIHREIQDKINHIRDHHIAHVLWPRKRNEGRSRTRTISRAEITAIFERVRQLFEVVSLTRQHIIDLNGYGRHPDGTHERAYIDDLLDQAARASAVVRRPEQYGERWPQRKKQMKPEVLHGLARWRARLGMSPP